MFGSLGFSLYGKSVTLYKTNYHYMAYQENLLNYGFDASRTHLVSSLRYLNSFQELKDNKLNLRV
jgi:hypothetical protein